jgi:glycerol-3-phosphate acyltransferase PlsY
LWLKGIAAMRVLSVFLFGGLGYLFGSLPFAIWVTRLVKGVDVREAGSGHATTTNAIRQAGWVAGAVVLVFDILKGFIPTYLALHYGNAAWAAPVSAAMAAVGHCWPVFAGFRGGMGLASSGGAILAVYPPAFLIGLGMLILLVLVVRHAARASVLTGVLLAPVYGLFGFPGPVIWVAAALGSVIAVRFLSDWNRRYRELWLDRKKRD